MVATVPKFILASTVMFGTLLGGTDAFAQTGDTPNYEFDGRWRGIAHGESCRQPTWPVDAIISQGRLSVTVQNRRQFQIEGSIDRGGKLVASGVNPRGNVRIELTGTFSQRRFSGKWQGPRCEATVNLENKGKPDSRWFGGIKSTGCNINNVNLRALAWGRDIEFSAGKRQFKYVGTIGNDQTVSAVGVRQHPASIVGRFTDGKFIGKFVGKLPGCRGEVTLEPQLSSAQLKSVSGELSELKRLRERGLITEDDLQQRRQKILDRTYGGKEVAARGGPATGPKFTVPQGVNFGTYHALVIGIDAYKNLTPLKTAVADANAVADLLQSRYDFKITKLINPTRDQILDALDKMQATLKYTDNLLIYYAGHGWLNDKSDQGYWLPVDAKQNRRSRWVSNSTLTDTLRAIEAKHVMVIADSCYSGRLVRDANIKLEAAVDPNYYKTMSRKKARVVITSGGLEPVEDGKGEHSPFAREFLRALQDNEGVLEGNKLFHSIRRPVMLSANQTPQYSDVRRAGHDGGDFMLVRRR